MCTLWRAQQWLLDYEMEHTEDVTGDSCALCGGGEEIATDWISCDSCQHWVRLRISSILLETFGNSLAPDWVPCDSCPCDSCPHWVGLPCFCTGLHEPLDRANRPREQEGASPRSLAPAASCMLRVLQFSFWDPLIEVGTRLTRAGARCGRRCTSLATRGRRQGSWAHSETTRPASGRSPTSAAAALRRRRSRPQRSRRRHPEADNDILRWHDGQSMWIVLRRGAVSNHTGGL